MDNRLKAIIAIVVLVVVTLPAWVSILKQGEGAEAAATNPPGQGQAVAKESDKGQDKAPAPNAKSSYHSDTAPAFVDDPAVIGDWVSVDFVQQQGDFKPGKQRWTGDLYLKGLTFFAGGRTSGPWTWTKGQLWHPGDRSLGKYEIKEMDGAKYLFMEWISGDVTMRGEKPRYYVMKMEAH